MKTLGYYNGEMAEIDEIWIPMNDRVCWFGDGVYEAAIAVNRTIFALDEHINRLFNSAGLLDMTVPLSKDALAGLLRSLVQKVESPTQFVYWQLTRGTADRTHAFPEGVKANLWVTIRPLKLNLQDISKKATLITVEDTRFLHCNIKTLNLIPNVMASEKAKQAGAKEAVFHRGDMVTECSHSNVHILKDGVFRTAPLNNLILPGITRAQLIQICGKLGITVLERAFTLDEMFAADEVLVSSTSAFCYPASHIDGRPVGGKAPELFRQISGALFEKLTEECGPVPA